MTNTQTMAQNMNPECPIVGLPLSAVGGPLHVLNTDSRTATNTPTDPDLIVHGGTPHATWSNIVKVPVPHGIYLDLFHLYLGTTTSSPQIRVYGKARTSGVSRPGGRLRGFPQDYNSDFPNYDEFWVPLNEEGNENLFLDFPNAPAISYTRLAGTLNQSSSRILYTGGCTESIVAVSSAATITGDPNEGMICGRFLG